MSEYASNMTDEEFLNNMGQLVSEETTAPIEQTQTTSPETVSTTDVEPPPENNVNAPAQVEQSTAPEQVNYIPGDNVEENTFTESSKSNEKIDYKRLYEEILNPFKANGKQIELQSIEEVKQLMQMGANYTKKMQDIAPYRKIISMLENNQLLDENKINYLIDLEKKNPQAITKLLKDSEIDPLEIDTSTESTYNPTNYKVSDEEELFKSTLDELSATDHGRTTISVINTEWDSASKEQLWKYPQMMSVIDHQRETGEYQQILQEVERAKILGRIPPNMSFLDAYVAVGNEIQGRDRVTQPNVAPVATRVATPKPQVVNNQSAKAASTPKSSPTKASIVNPLALSDDEFMKQFEKFQNRV